MESSGDGDDMFPQFVTKIISLTKYSSALSLAVARVRFPLGRMMLRPVTKTIRLKNGLAHTDVYPIRETYDNVVQSGTYQARAWSESATDC